MKKTVDAVRKSPGVSLCTDGSTFKQKGLSTHIDIGVRYWDESAGEVVDDFLDFHSVGHEPADLQVRLILASLEKANIHQSKVVCLSRDNPNVMKRVFKLLEESFRAANNPKLVDAPCLLHTTPLTQASRRQCWLWMKTLALFLQTSTPSSKSQLQGEKT